jgi:hypothetical protein
VESIRVDSNGTTILLLVIKTGKFAGRENRRYLTEMITAGFPIYKDIVYTDSSRYNHNRV